MWDSMKKLIKTIRKNNNETIHLHKRSKLEKFVYNNQNLVKALTFFRNNSGSIDVLLKNGIEQVHFPYMPYCTYLT